MPKQAELKRGKTLYRTESGELVDFYSLTDDEQAAAKKKMMKRTGDNFSDHLAQHPERWKFYFEKKTTTA